MTREDVAVAGLNLLFWATIVYLVAGLVHTLGGLL